MNKKSKAEQLFIISLIFILCIGVFFTTACIGHTKIGATDETDDGWDHFYLGAGCIESGVTAGTFVDATYFDCTFLGNCLGCYWMGCGDYTKSQCGLECAGCEICGKDFVNAVKAIKIILK